MIADKKGRHTPDLFGADPGGVEDDEPDDGPTGQDYFDDPADGLPAEAIKPHSRDKHQIVRMYVDICQGVRGKWIGLGHQATYVDLFCGPGRACDSRGREFFDASPLIAWDVALHPTRGESRPFTDVIFADKDPTLVDAATKRLKQRGAPIRPFTGEAEETVDEAVKLLNEGFHFALLDPYGIKQLPFSIIEKLAAVPKLDMLIHVSGSGLRRNLGFNVIGAHANFDRFAPGWRQHYNRSRPDQENVRAIFDWWARKIGMLGKEALGTEAITAGGLPLYWLVLVSGHPRALEFWDKITKLRRQRPLLIP